MHNDGDKYSQSLEQWQVFNHSIYLVVSIDKRCGNKGKFYLVNGGAIVSDFSGGFRILNLGDQNTNTQFFLTYI